MCMLRSEDVPPHIRAARRREEERSVRRTFQMSLRPHGESRCLSAEVLFEQGLLPESARKGPVDREIWSDIDVARITREQADAAASERLPGFLFGWSGPKGITDAGDPALCCGDAALVLGVLARVREGYYQSSHIPDYSLGHLLNTKFFCCDVRIPAQGNPDREASS